MTTKTDSPDAGRRSAPSAQGASTAAVTTLPSTPANDGGAAEGAPHSESAGSDPGGSFPRNSPESFKPSGTDDESWRTANPKTRIDPTRYERVVEAMRLVRRLKPDKRHSERNYLYVSKGALYDHIRQCLAECGLHVRTRLEKPIEVCAELDLGSTRSSSKSNVATIEIDVSFAFAAPLDGPEAPLHWERRPLSGPCRDVQSQGHLWGLTRKYWLQDALLVSEDDSGQTTTVDPEQDRIDGGSMERVGRQRSHRGSGRNREWDDGPPNDSAPDDSPPDDRPPEDPPVDPSIDIEEKILRGVDRAGLSPADAAKLREESGDDPAKMLRALINIVAKKDADAASIQPTTGSKSETDPEAAPDTDPAARPATDNLTFTERKTVVAATRNAAIPDETVGRIIRGLLGAPTIGKLTLAEINGAVERYKVEVPAAASWADVMIAVLKHLRDRAPATDSSENSAADGGEDGSAPPPRGGEPASGDSQPLDSVEAGHANIAAASMLTLEIKDRTAAERIKNNHYETWRERSAAIDAAIAEADRRTTRTPRPAGGSRQRRAEDSSRGGDGERPEPLSLSEQVAFQLRNIPNDEIAILKKMAKGDEKKLLELAEKYHSSGK